MQDNQYGPVKAINNRHVTLIDPQPSKPANKTTYTVSNIYSICHIQRKQVVKPTHTDNSAAASLLPTTREER